MKKILFFATMLASILTVATMASCSEDNDNNNVEPGSIELNKKVLTMLPAEKDTLKVISTNLKNGETYVWSIDNKDIATVDQKGVVTAISKGTAIVSVKVGELLARCVVTVTEEVSEAISIPDSIFKEYLIKNTQINKNGDTVITVKEAREFTGEIDVKDKKIKNISGLHYFTNIYKLNCSNTEIKKLDVSSNSELLYLICNRTRIDSLNVDKNKILNCLDLNNTDIKTINVINNESLELLNCSNTIIDSIDISKNNKLKSLSCNDTKIRYLNVDANPSLIDLSFSNTNIKSINVEKNLYLAVFNCSNTGIEKLNVSQNQNLMTLICASTNIKYINLNNNASLEFLALSNCKNLEGLERNPGTLDLTKNSNLKSFDSTGTPKLNILVWKDFNKPPIRMWYIDTDGDGIDTVINNEQ